MQRAGDIPGAIGSTFVLADIKMTLGHLHEAASTCERALKLAAELANQCPRELRTCIRNKRVTPRTGRSGSRRTRLGYKQEAGEQVELPDWQYRWCIAQARLKETLGDLDSALDLLDERSACMSGPPCPMCIP